MDGCSKCAVSLSSDVIPPRRALSLCIFAPSPDLQPIHFHMIHATLRDVPMSMSLPPLARQFHRTHEILVYLVSVLALLTRHHSKLDHSRLTPAPAINRYHFNLDHCGNTVSASATAIHSSSTTSLSYREPWQTSRSRLRSLACRSAHRNYQTCHFQGSCATSKCHWQNKSRLRQLTNSSPRSRIYSHLLDGEFVRTKRTWSRAEYEDNFDNDRTGHRAYYFHTNVLGVNRAIRNEAEELLYKRNMFIVLSYEYFGLGNENGGLYWLPIVSNRHAPRMKKHSVRIHVSPGTAGYRDPALSGDASMHSAIFLARDLEVFCLIMTTAGSSIVPTNLAVALYVSQTGAPTVGPPGFPNTPKVAAPQFKCELRNTQYRQIDEATQRQILAPMARILAPSQRVVLKGIVCDLEQVERQKQIMSPTLICYPAFKRAFFEAMSLAKDVVDAAVPYDDISFVMNLYHTIAVTLAVCTYTHFLDQGQRQAFLFTCPETAEACDILKLEALVDKACCAVKARDIKELREASDGIQQSMTRRKAEHRSQEVIPPQLKAHCDSVMLWRKLYFGEECDMPTVRDAVQDLTVFGHGPHQVHDSEILLRHADQEAVLTRKHLPLDQCSAFQLPLPNISQHGALLKQERFRGWLDMGLLRSLPSGLKKQINQQQEQYGIKVTGFDELLQ